MTVSDEERQREYPGDRFAERVIEQDLDALAERLNNEEFGEGHLEQGHNQIELYRHDGTTVSMFVMDEGASLPEHSVEDGSVMIQVIDGKVTVNCDGTDDSPQPDTNTVITLQPGVAHSIEAEAPSRLLVTIMRG